MSAARRRPSTKANSADSRRIGVLLPTREMAITGNYTMAPLLDFAQQAEGLGFDSLWTGDSLLARPRLDPMVVLAAAAAVTSTISIGTAALTAALRPPLLGANMIASLEQAKRAASIPGWARVSRCRRPRRSSIRSGYPSPAARRAWTRPSRCGGRRGAAGTAASSTSPAGTPPPAGWTGSRRRPPPPDRHCGWPAVTRRGSWTGVARHYDGWMPSAHRVGVRRGLEADHRTGRRVRPRCRCGHAIVLRHHQRQCRPAQGARGVGELRTGRPRPAAGPDDEFPGVRVRHRAGVCGLAVGVRAGRRPAHRDPDRFAGARYAAEGDRQRSAAGGSGPGVTPRRSGRIHGFLMFQRSASSPRSLGVSFI